MEKTTIACTAPNCKKSLAPEAMWLPEWKAMLAANGGQRLAVSDFPKYALCGYHGHLLRKEGVRVYRYEDSVRRETEREDRRKAEQLPWTHFAQRFVQQTKPGGGNGRRPRSDDGRNVGGGLSRFTRTDGNTRRDE